MYANLQISTLGGSLWFDKGWWGSVLFSSHS